MRTTRGTYICMGKKVQIPGTGTRYKYSVSVTHFWEFGAHALLENLYTGLWNQDSGVRSSGMSFGHLWAEKWYYRECQHNGHAGGLRVIVYSDASKPFALYPCCFGPKALRKKSENGAVNRMRTLRKSSPGQVRWTEVQVDVFLRHPEDNSSVTRVLEVPEYLLSDYFFFRRKKAHPYRGKNQKSKLKFCGFLSPSPAL